MKLLDHAHKDHSTGLVDSQTGKSLKTLKVVDLSDEIPPTTFGGLRLYYTNAKQGEIVQLVQTKGISPGVQLHYFVDYISKELERPSSLDSMAIWTGATKEQLVAACIKYRLP